LTFQSNPRQGEDFLDFFVAFGLEIKESGDQQKALLANFSSKFRFFRPRCWHRAGFLDPRFFLA